MTSPPVRAMAIVLTVLATVGAGAVTPATAASTKAAVPSKVSHKITTSSVTVKWKAAKKATGYSVCVMTRKATETCHKSSDRDRATKAKFTGLSPTGGADYFYRVYAYKGKASSRSAKERVDLPVKSISTVTATKDGPDTIDARWTAARNAEAYELQLATNSAMTKKLKTYTAKKTKASPSGLTTGKTYYYRVRGVNGRSHGDYTAVRSLRLTSDPSQVVVLTYNLCGQDKCVTSANKMKKWSSRKPLAGKIVRDAGAGIVATQESSNKDTRLITELPGYGLAATLSAKSLFYDKAKYDVARSGSITLSSATKRYAVWAEFRDKTTGNSFIVSDSHLEPYKGKTKDDMRSAQTKVLINQVAAVNTKKLPVIHAGDFNSNSSNVQKAYPGGYDAPLKAFTAAGIPDAYTTAGSGGRVDSTFNSANQAINPPLKNSHHVDHIFADKDVTVSDWRVLVQLSGKRYATPFGTDHNPVRAVLTVPGR